MNLSVHQHHPHYTKGHLTNNANSTMLYLSCQTSLQVNFTCLSVSINRIYAECDEQWLTTCKQGLRWLVLLSLPFFVSLNPHSESVCSHYLCLCSASARSLLYTPPLSLKPTPWQPVAVSPIKVDNLPVVPQQLNATSESMACCIINQPRGAVRIIDTREKVSERES